jgi:hypothetical protein
VQDKFRISFPFVEWNNKEIFSWKKEVVSEEITKLEMNWLYSA